MSERPHSYTGAIELQLAIGEGSEMGKSEKVRAKQRQRLASEFKRRIYTKESLVTPR